MNVHKITCKYCIGLKQELQKDLAVRERNFDALIEKTTMLQDKYQSAETQNLAKDAVVLMKKYEAVKNRGDKIADLLAASLEQHCQDAQVQEQRWINATKEKVAWCGDIGGDRYSMEAKLATVKVSYYQKRKMRFIPQDLKFTAKNYIHELLSLL